MSGQPAPQRYRRNRHRFTYGACPLCGRPGVRLITDHCHRHGWVRGRICESCNQSLRHAERRYTLTELVHGLPCGIVHRTSQAHEKCQQRYQRASGPRIAHYLRCPGCAREAAGDG